MSKAKAKATEMRVANVHFAHVLHAKLVGVEDVELKLD
jgi:hypothetical protein